MLNQYEILFIIKKKRLKELKKAPETELKDIEMKNLKAEIIFYKYCMFMNIPENSKHLTNKDSIKKDNEILKIKELEKYLILLEKSRDIVDNFINGYDTLSEKIRAHLSYVLFRDSLMNEDMIELSLEDVTEKQKHKRMNDFPSNVIGVAFYEFKNGVYFKYDDLLYIIKNNILYEIKEKKDGKIAISTEDIFLDFKGIEKNKKIQLKRNIIGYFNNEKYYYDIISSSFFEELETLDLDLAQTLELIEMNIKK